MDGDAIDRLSPDARIEVTEYYLLVDTKRRDFRDRGQPDRRSPRRWLAPWPHVQPWTVHAEMPAMRVSWTSSYIAARSPEWRQAHGFTPEAAADRPRRTGR